MVKLKKFVCSHVSNEARELYDGLQNNNEEENRFVNTTFELEIIEKIFIF